MESCVAQGDCSRQCSRQLLLHCSRRLFLTALYLVHPCTRTFAHPWARTSHIHVLVSSASIHSSPHRGQGAQNNGSVNTWRESSITILQTVMHVIPAKAGIQGLLITGCRLYRFGHPWPFATLEHPAHRAGTTRKETFWSKLYRAQSNLAKLCKV